tara:strand:- start:747 stop:1118 length:372 start_codon:yes stop_codon:yes gene_type:complete
MYNWLNCPELYTHLKSYTEQFPWLIDKNYIPRIDFNLNLRPKDSEMSAKWLPNNILDKGLELWQHTDCRQYKEFEKYVVNAKKLSSDDKNLYREKIKYTTTTLDKQRKQTFAVLDSEIVKWLK